MRDPFGIVGTTLDRRYTILRVVAEGGFGVVYEAEALTLGMRVAIKVLKFEMQGAKARFAQEAKLLVRLRHPAIVELYDAAHLEDGTPYLVLAWIEGETLESYFAHSNPMQLDEALRLFEPVASALAYAHQAGVVHRDLKPANIMFGSHKLHVLDFGVARWDHSLAVQTTTLASTGLSLGYAAPEQYSKEFGSVDARADQFAFASIVFAALSGIPPFKGDSLAAVVFATCSAAERPSLALYRPDLPIAVAQVLQKAFAIQPAERFSSIVEFWNSLVSATGFEKTFFESTFVTLPASAPNTQLRTAPIPITLPSPQLPLPQKNNDTKSVVYEPSMAYASTQPTYTRKTGSPSLSQETTPLSSAKVKKSWLKWLFVGLIFGLMGGGAALYATQISAWINPSQPQKPQRSRTTAKPIVPQSSLSTSSTSTASLVPLATPSTTLAAKTVSTVFEQSPCGRSIKPDEVCIQGGLLRRGPSDCKGTTDVDHLAACPEQRVSVASFWIDRYEVTRAQYRACVAAHSCAEVSIEDSNESPKNPIRNVSWQEATQFCAWDHNRRLPTDDEWEFAAAGSSRRAFPWGNEDPNLKRAIYTHDPNEPLKEPSFVGSGHEGSSPEGIFDLAGNVAEWTITSVPAEQLTLLMQTQLDAGQHNDTAPVTPYPNHRWVRGGSFQDLPTTLHSWVRKAVAEEHRSPTIGFRCVRSATRFRND